MTDGSTQNPGLMAGSWDHWTLGRSSGRPRVCASRIPVGSGTRSASGGPGAERTSATPGRASVALGDAPQPTLARHLGNSRAGLRGPRALPTRSRPRLDGSEGRHGRRHRGIGDLDRFQSFGVLEADSLLLGSLALGPLLKSLHR